MSCFECRHFSTNNGINYCKVHDSHEIGHNTVCLDEFPQNEEGSCPKCDADLRDDLIDAVDWKDCDADEGFFVWTGISIVKCKCGAEVEATLTGTQHGHPDIGNEIEDIEIDEVEIKEA